MRSGFCRMFWRGWHGNQLDPTELCHQQCWKRHGTLGHLGGSSSDSRDTSKTKDFVRISHSKPLKPLLCLCSNLPNRGSLNNEAYIGSYRLAIHGYMYIYIYLQICILYTIYIYTWYTYYIHIIHIIYT